MARRAVEIDIADQPLVGAVDADVDYRRARLDPLPLDELRHADGGDDDIGAVNYARKIASARLRDRDGAAFLSQPIGRASGRDRVCQSVLISVVAVKLKKKYNTTKQQTDYQH